MSVAITPNITQFACSVNDAVNPDRVRSSQTIEDKVIAKHKHPRLGCDVRSRPSHKRLSQKQSQFASNLVKKSVSVELAVARDMQPYIFYVCLCGFAYLELGAFDRAIPLCLIPSKSRSSSCRDVTVVDRPCSNCVSASFQSWRRRSDSPSRMAAIRDS